LDLLRHGDAVAAGQDGDAARSLSSNGRRDVARIAEEFARQGWRPDRVFVSPLRRAQETAAILLARIDPPVDPETLRELVPDYPASSVVSALVERAAAGHVLLIGHQPLLGQLAALLSGDPETAFPPAGLTRIALADGLVAGEGRIELRLHPRELP